MFTRVCMGFLRVLWFWNLDYEPQWGTGINMRDDISVQLCGIWWRYIKELLFLQRTNSSPIELLDEPAPVVVSWKVRLWM